MESYTHLLPNVATSQSFITLLERPSPHVSPIASIPTRQVIHTCSPASPLVDIRINTLLKRPSPHVSPIASIHTQQGSNSRSFASSESGTWIYLFVYPMSEQRYSMKYRGKVGMVWVKKVMEMGVLDLFEVVVRMVKSEDPSQ
ncbi:hypothetical protein ACLOJK_006875 [Asimina triloba]